MYKYETHNHFSNFYRAPGNEIPSKFLADLNVFNANPQISGNQDPPKQNPL